MARIVRDSRGFQWFCTGGGLSRFDGSTFRSFGTAEGLPPGPVNNLLETRRGQYWLATNGGLVYFDPAGRPNQHVVYARDATRTEWMFTVVLPEDDNRRSRASTALLEDRDGVLWVGTQNGLYQLEGPPAGPSLHRVEIGIPTEYPEQGFVADLLEDARGALWIGAPGGLYRRWADGSAARYLPGQYVQDLLEDRGGHLWVGTRLDGFFRLSADASHAAPAIEEHFTYPGELPRTSWVFQLFEASDGRFWIATARGLLEYFPNGTAHNRFRSYTEWHGLSYFDVTAIAEDTGGNLWLGTKHAGAMKLTRGGFTTFGRQDAIETVQAVFQDRAGNLCVRGSVLGDARRTLFEGATLDMLRPEPPSFHPRLGCFDGQHFVWFRPEGVTDFGWVGEQVTLQARTGEWWLGTGEGLFRYPKTDRLATLVKTRPSATYTMKDGLAALQVYRLFEDSRGGVWVSTLSASAAGLARWDPIHARLEAVEAPPLSSLTRDDGPARSFAQDSAGNVWIGFDGRLARYQDGHVTLFTASDGLPPGPVAIFFSTVRNASGLRRIRAGWCAWRSGAPTGRDLLPRPLRSSRATVSP